MPKYLLEQVLTCLALRFGGVLLYFRTRAQTIRARTDHEVVAEALGIHQSGAVSHISRPVLASYANSRAFTTASCWLVSEKLSAFDDPVLTAAPVVNDGVRLTPGRPNLRSRWSVP